jgi:aspartyl-tRNA(Asn)/glutamyl-tRNA(Gln) amidotransferase subunit A
VSDLAFLSLGEAARLIRSKALSPVEYTSALLARIDRINPKCNAFLTVSAEQAMAQAKTAESEIVAGQYRGPMHGMPYAVKDIFDVEGMATTCHSRLRINHRATSDAFVVGRLRKAGAVLLGKLALHEFAIGGPAFDLPWPPARNPWDLRMHPGGSSSGSGAALAAGLAPATLGTDTGGSVRNPAACCGIVGLKPTYGLVSVRGVFPLSMSLDHVGPMTRTVEDNAMLLDAIAGPDADDPLSAQRAAPNCLTTINAGIKGMRIGVISHFYERDAEADAEQIAGIQAAIDVLRKLGADVAIVDVQPLSMWQDCYRVIMPSESFAVHQADMAKRPEDYAAITRDKILPGAFVSASKYIGAQQLRRLLCDRMQEAMRGFDAVITLSGLYLPTPIEDTETVTRFYDRQCRMVFNITGMPAISVPTGSSKSGLPLAMQIAGHAFDEATVYRIAQAYCTAAGTMIGTAAASQPAL